MRSVIWVSFALAFTYLNFWPTPIEPKRWPSPKNADYIGAFKQNSLLEELTFFDISGTRGPEGLALGNDGTIYASSNEGWIPRHNPSTGGIDRWLTTGGRPLGIAVDQESNLLVADAFLGLLSISPNQTITILSNRVNGSPIKHANGADIAPDGKFLLQRCINQIRGPRIRWHS